MLADGHGLVGSPPFRAPHHGISAAGLIGGGAKPMPGEISLAHRGVLFLDELPEFRRDALEAIRQPLEERRVMVVRVGGACVFPSDFLLIAAMNPCPCGFLGDSRRPCVCDGRERRRYGRKLSGPLLDRVDLHVPMAAVPWRDLIGGRRASPPPPSASASPPPAPSPPSAGRTSPATATRTFLHKTLCSIAPLDAAGRRILESAVQRLQLSVRALHRALRVARTIADLGGFGAPAARAPGRSPVLSRRWSRRTFALPG